MMKVFSTQSLRGKSNVVRNGVLMPLAVCLVALGGLLGCAQKTESQEDEKLIGYPLVGVVLEVNQSNETLKVAHEDIPNFMPAMTMDFRVSAEELNKVKPKMKIYARLVRDEDGGFRLINIMDDEAAVRKANEKLEAQTKSLSTGYYFGEGDAMPDFALLDQNGNVVTPESLEGKAFMLNFIFTRCTDANMCPLSTSKMAKLQRRAAEKGVENLEFISITLDPEFDTPEVLKAYAEGYGIDGKNFRFVTGDQIVVRQLIKSLGVTRIIQDENIAHSLVTLLVDSDRKIAMRSDRSAWEPESFLAAIESL